MNHQKFLDDWRKMGPAKQLAVLLAALLRKHPDGSIALPLAELADITDSPVEPTIICRELSDKIHLLYAGERVTLYEIQDSVHEKVAAWPHATTHETHLPGPSPMDYGSSLTYPPTTLHPPPQSSGVKSDEELADLEARSHRLANLRSRAGSARLQPLAPASPRGNGHRPPSAAKPPRHRRAPSPAELQSASNATVDSESAQSILEHLPPVPSPLRGRGS